MFNKGPFNSPFLKRPDVHVTFYLFYYCNIKKGYPNFDIFGRIQRFTLCSTFAVLKRSLVLRDIRKHSTFPITFFISYYCSRKKESYNNFQLFENIQRLTLLSSLFTTAVVRKSNPNFDLFRNIEELNLLSSFLLQRS